MRALLIACLTLLLTIISSDGYGQTQNIYVCNQGSATVSVLNTATNEITATIDLKELGFSANAKPHYAIAEPDGSFWYITMIGENRVLKFNSDNELVASAEFEVPGLMTMDPNSDLLYVGRSMSAVNPPQSFGIIRRSDMELLQEVDLFFGRPHAIATIPSTNWVFIASLSSNQFLSVNTETEELDLKDLDGMNNVIVNFAISPDKKTMVATGQVTGKLLVFDITDPAGPELTETIDVNAEPWHPVYSSDGRYVYFGNKGANSVTVVDMEAMKVDDVIEGEGLAQPHGAGLSADGKYLYISNSNMKMSDMNNHAGHGKPGNLVIIDTATHEIVKVIEIGMNPTGLGTNVR